MTSKILDAFTKGADSLRNFVSSLGTGADKATGGQFYFTELDRRTLDAMFRGNWIARKIVKAPAEDMTREGRRWIADKDFIEAMEAEWTRLDLAAKVYQAVVLARQCGGAGILLGDGGQGDQPLNVTGIGGLKYAVVLSKYYLPSKGLETDPASEFFGTPAMYQLTLPGLAGAAQEIHPSRVIRFVGEPILDPDQMQTSDRGWGDSTLQAVHTAIRNSEAATNALAALVEDAKTDVIAIPNLLNLVTTDEGASRLTRRIAYANQTKSTVNALLIDGGSGGKDAVGAETWEQRQVNFTGIPDVLRVFLEVVAGASDIPVTRLLGVSAKGMNATGEGDDDNYQDMIGGLQQRMLDPAYARLDAAVAVSATGKPVPDEAYYEHNPLTQVDDETAAKIAKTKAETAQIYVDTALVPADALAKAVQNGLIEDGTFPGLEAALSEAKMVIGEALTDPNAPDPMELLQAQTEAKQAANDPGRPVVANGPGGSQRGIAQRPAADRIRDASPRPLYVSRQVLNAAAIIAHFKAQGLTSLRPADEMHVTVTYSRDPVDWFAMGSSWSGETNGNLRIAPGGPRLVEPLGSATAVLLIASEDLTWRHDRMIEAGASWDFTGYQPHITLSYAPVPDLKGVEPYKGEIILGPEIYEELVEDLSGAPVPA